MQLSLQEDQELMLPDTFSQSIHIPKAVTFTNASLLSEVFVRHPLGSPFWRLCSDPVEPEQMSVETFETLLWRRHPRCQTSSGFIRVQHVDQAGECPLKRLCRPPLKNHPLVVQLNVPIWCCGDSAIALKQRSG